MKPRLILFDIDGTLTTKDTMLEYIKFVRGNGRFLWGMFVLLPVLVGMKAGMVRNDVAKMRLLKFHFKGMSRKELEEKAEAFAREVFPGLLRPGGLKALEEYRAAGDRILLVSASLRLWIGPWARSQDLELLSTEGRWADGRFAGELATPNCHGPEKVTRIKAHLDLGDYPEVIAYGDSSGDTEMLALADQGHFQPFRD